MHSTIQTDAGLAWSHPDLHTCETYFAVSRFEKDEVTNALQGLPPDISANKPTDILAIWRVVYQSIYQLIYQSCEKPS